MYSRTLLFPLHLRVGEHGILLPLQFFLHLVWHLTTFDRLFEQVFWNGNVLRDNRFGLQKVIKQLQNIQHNEARSCHILLLKIDIAESFKQ